jgi:hypothetical protein
MDQLDQFLGPQIFTWVKLMSILSVLLLGEERGMVRRAAMIVWECEHLPGPNVLPADVKFSNQEPQWDNSNAI